MKLADKAGLALTIAFLCASPVQAAGERFIDELGDVPLMEGLRVVSGSVVNFDSPNGRIVRLKATGGAEPRAIRRFYQTSLPNLGWRRTGESFVREGETLTLEITRRGQTTIIHYSLAPRER